MEVKLASLADVFGLACDEPNRCVTDTEKYLLDVLCYSGNRNAPGFGMSVLL